MIERILLGLIVTVVGSAIIYAFRVRQLYVVLPRLFSVSALTSTGKLVEIRVFNKSRTTEEEVLVALSPERTYEIVASTDSSPILDKYTIRIPRIPPGDDFSVLMMVEGGNFTKDEISTVSSKTTKGKVMEDIEHVPPNVGNVILSTACFVAVIAAFFAGISTYEKWKDSVAQRERAERIESLSFLAETGWTSLDEYAVSNLRKNYNQGEFPLFQKDLKRDGNTLIVAFSIINKSAAPLSVTAIPDRPYHDRDPRPWENTISESVSVGPADKSELSLRVFWPKNQDGALSVEFSFDFRGERFIRVVKNVQVDQ